MRRRTVLAALSFAIAAAPPTGCSRNSGGKAAASWQEVRSNLPRNENPNVSPEALTGFMERELAFSLAFFRQARGDLGVSNPVFSPLSVWVALAMTYAGATGESAEEMAHALEFVGIEGQVHALMDALILELEGSAVNSKQADSEFDFSLADAVWLHSSFRPASAFLDILAQYYGAGVYLVDFEKDPAGAVAAINKWIAQQTHDRIRDALEEDSVSPTTKLVLVNALYFKGRWEHPFPEASTAPRPFFLEDGTETSVDTMMIRGPIRYAEVAGTKIVELNYKGGAFSLLAVMPPQGTSMEAFLTNLDPTALRSLLDGLVVTDLELYFPKLHNEVNVKLSEVLQAMGIHAAFSALGDFEAMSEDGVPLRIEQVLHQTYFDLDEHGTEAAAATEVIMGDAGIGPGPQPNPTVVRFDHPFLFFLRERTHGILLFTGLMDHP